jgi:hypothetical protein
MQVGKLPIRPSTLTAGSMCVELTGGSKIEERVQMKIRYILVAMALPIFFLLLVAAAYSQG